MYFPSNPASISDRCKIPQDNYQNAHSPSAFARCITELYFTRLSMHLSHAVMSEVRRRQKKKCVLHDVHSRNALLAFVEIYSRMKDFQVVAQMKRAAADTSMNLKRLAVRGGTGTGCDVEEVVGALVWDRRLEREEIW